MNGGPAVSAGISSRMLDGLREVDREALCRVVATAPQRVRGVSPLLRGALDARVRDDTSLRVVETPPRALASPGA